MFCTTILLLNAFFYSSVPETKMKDVRKIKQKCLFLIKISRESLLMTLWCWKTPTRYYFQTPTGPHSRGSSQRDERSQSAAKLAAALMQQLRMELSRRLLSHPGRHPKRENQNDFVVSISPSGDSNRLAVAIQSQGRQRLVYSTHWKAATWHSTRVTHVFNTAKVWTDDKVTHEETACSCTQLQPRSLAVK